MRSERTCSIPDCGRPVEARGWCNRHYKSWKRHGDPLAVEIARTQMLPGWWDRFKRQPNGCLYWTGPFSKGGYGKSSGRGSAKGEQWVHRIVYRLKVGPIPEGLHVLHRCDNRPCGDPAHLFLGTPAANMADMVAKGRQVRYLRGTHCKRGHEYTPENTILRPSRSGNPAPGQMTRWCRTCKNAKNSAWERQHPRDRRGRRR